MNYEPVIGLEIHSQLATKTKLFCRCPVPADTPAPNTCICPVCTGQPGVLPVLNRRAVELGIKAAISLGCKLNDRSIFARKNYFYPDLPKNYQISQYEEPLAEHGHVEIPKRIGILRAHLEEDAGKLLHAIGSEELPYSLVDFNRCGVPLIEIVSEPDLRSPEEAYQYLVGLKTILQWIGASNCDMEKGELRCDVNISLRPSGSRKFGEKVEIKNLNSFKAVKDALHYEISRQEKALSSGERIAQETRLWDEKSDTTISMRSKEEAHDYRYFPDPDLVPLVPARDLVEKIRSSILELPQKRKERFISDHKLSPYDAGVLISDRELSEYFESCVGSGVSAKLAVNWITTELLGRLNSEKLEISKSPVSAPMLSGLITLVESGKISGKMGKDVFERMWKTGKPANEIVESLGMSQVSDTAQIEVWVREAITEKSKAADDVRKGNEKAIGALVGAVMKKSKGKANPQAVNSILKKLLEK